MKKVLLTALYIATALTAQAQIADGSDAPDFTVTDLNGNTHSLSAYLAEGKTVIMDISATWCSPCWSFHHSGTFEELYYTYGQGGSGEVVMLFVEGDANTPLECLYGISDNNLTWGNWTEHSSFPIINSSELYSLYEMNYFPTFFRICPDGKVNEIEQPDNGIQGMDVEFFKNNVSNNCSTISGLQRNAKPVIADIKVCGESTVSPEITIYDYGTEPVSTATVEIRQGATVLATKEFSGSIAMLGAADITFDPFEIGPGTAFEAVVTAINGETPMNTTTAATSFVVEETGVSNNNITVKVYTDLYPGEISWAIKNSVGETVASGGPYQPGTDDNNGMGGPDSDTTKEHAVILPEGNDCYTVELYDEYGDGWIVGEAHHGFEILSGGEIIFEVEDMAFGSSLLLPYAFKSNGMLDNPAFDTANFAMYPNPTTGILHFRLTEPADITIIDLTGKVVHTAAGMDNGGTMDLSALQKGIYVARVKTSGAQKTLKVAIH